jgi:hypothetical protein
MVLIVKFRTGSAVRQQSHAENFGTKNLNFLYLEPEEAEHIPTEAKLDWLAPSIKQLKKEGFKYINNGM